MSNLEVTNIVRTFPSGNEVLHVLNGVSFRLEAGSMTTIKGESGSGKSTLLSLIAGLDRPDEGSVRIGDRELTGMGEEALTAYRGRHIGLIFQFHYLLRDFTALENVMLPSYMLGESRKSAEKRATRLIDDLGLSDRKESLPAQLSGGERQRLACARALMNDPELVLADEPTGNLDEENSEQVVQVLFDLVRSRGKTLLLVTHSMELAARTGRILHLEGGRVREEA